MNKCANINIQTLGLHYTKGSLMEMYNTKTILKFLVKISSAALPSVSYLGFQNTYAMFLKL